VIHEWTNAKVTINGKPIECVAVSFERPEESGPPLPVVRRSYEATATFYLDAVHAAPWRALMEDYRRYMQRFAMLMKRTQYGGRKGRRAWRRLAEMQR
jgi:hypothetical protein